MAAFHTPVEKIIHKTGESPFSLHHTVLPTGETNALYLHCHPEAEFLYLEKGEVLFTIENQSFSLKAGDGIFIPPGLIHSAIRTASSNTPCSYFAIVFEFSHLEKLFSQGTSYFQAIYGNRADCIYVINQNNPENIHLLSNLQTVFRFYQCDPNTCELAIHGILLLCWQELYNHHLHRLTPLGTVSKNLQSELQKAQDYIWAHFSENVSLSDLAISAGFSESYFCHAFKSCTGYTPFEYLNRARIIKSCELLSQTSKKITEIASLCGFNNISYYNRMFSRIMGVTPSAYRKKS